MSKLNLKENLNNMYQSHLELSAKLERISKCQSVFYSIFNIKILILYLYLEENLEQISLQRASEDNEKLIQEQIQDNNRITQKEIELLIQEEH